MTTTGNEEHYAQAAEVHQQHESRKTLNSHRILGQGARPAKSLPRVAAGKAPGHELLAAGIRLIQYLESNGSVLDGLPELKCLMATVPPTPQTCLKLDEAITVGVDLPEQLLKALASGSQQIKTDPDSARA